MTTVNHDVTSSGSVSQPSLMTKQKGTEAGIQTFIEVDKIDK